MESLFYLTKIMSLPTTIPTCVCGWATQQL